MPEWEWYVEHVIEPTIEEYTQKIMTGDIETEKQEWIIRGMVMGLRMATSATEGFKSSAKEAKKKRKMLDKELESEF